MANVQVILSLPVLRKGSQPETGPTVVKQLQLMLNQRGGFPSWSRMATLAHPPRRRSSTISRTRTSSSTGSSGDKRGRLSLVQVALAVGARLNARAYRPPLSASGRAPIEEAFAIA